jgi:hypothetical protein
MLRLLLLLLPRRRLLLLLLLPLLLHLQPVLLYLLAPQHYGVPSVLRLPLSLQEF